MDIGYKIYYSKKSESERVEFENLVEVETARIKYGKAITLVKQYLLQSSYVLPVPVLLLFIIICLIPFKKICKL